MNRVRAAAIAILAGVLGMAPHHAVAQQPARTLRIGVWTLWRDKEITVAPAAPVRSGAGATLRRCPTCSPAPLKNAVQIRAMDHLVSLGRESTVAVSFSGPVTLAAHGEKLTMPYPLRIAARDGTLMLSIVMPIESYVERVVASESGANDSAESMKALAVVVRSFALHQDHGHAEYDLCDSTHCQFLHWGSNGERRAAAHAATLATAGETLWFRGRRAEAWFHQNCGGRTASPAEVWLGGPGARHPMPWLASHADNYCTASGAREWSTEISRQDLTAALAAQGMARPGWSNLIVSRRGESGRAVTLRADAMEISAEDFRLAVGRSLGWNRIPSTWFEVSRQGDRFLFHGRGSGHGVGLCQAGAAAMAASGHGYREILAQYFPGANVADEATGMEWQSYVGQGFRLESLDHTDAAFLPDLARALAEAESRSGLRPAGTISLRSFRSTPGFRDATGAPGWVAAFTEGDWIGLQPLRTLAGRRILASVLRHEFLHVLVESQATARSPLWLREGLAEAWSEGKLPAPAMRLDQVEQGLIHATTEVQSEAVHRAAGWYAAQLLDRFGRAQVLEWLRTGVPAASLSTLQSR